VTRVGIFLGSRLLICGATTLENHVPPCINIVEGAQMPEATLQICLKFLPMRNGGMKPLDILLRFIVLFTLRVSGMKGIDSLNRYFLISLVQFWGVLLEIL
jgi:hypothetical protein